MTGPFVTAPERVLTLEKPLTILGIIRKHDLLFRLPTIAVVTGGGESVPVLRKDWRRRKIARGEVLTFVAVPRGGGGDNSGKQIALLIATIALSIAAPYAGAAIAGAVGLAGSALAVNIASTAFLIGGSLLLGVLFNPRLETPQAGEEVYTVNAGSNRASPLEPIPVLYGELKYPPPLAARPYSEFEGNEQYLYQLHCLTCGIADPSRWHIGETLAWTAADGFTASFSGIEIEIIQPGDDITLFPANVVVSDNVSSQTVPDPPDAVGGFAVNQAGTSIDSIAIDFVFPGGLYTGGGSGGSISNATRQLVAEYREIDDDGDPVGPGTWLELFAETFTRKTRTPQRFSRRADVAPGRYEARLRALNADTSEAGTIINRVNWVGLRGYLTNWTIPSDVTLVATKIRANDQLSQVSSNQYFFTVKRRLPIYDTMSETWGTPTFTSGIAWAAADLIRNTDYGLGLSDSLFDLDWIAAYNAVWAGRDDEFNGLFDRKWIAQDALNAILRVGRSGSVRIGGKIGFVRDEPKLVKRATFTSRNIVKGSFSRRFVLFDDESPDHIVARYVDRTSWREREVNAIISSVGSAEPIEREYFGITDRDHTWREAIRDAAENAYRREFATFQTELEGKLLIRGDPILVHGPLLRNVFVAGLTERAGDVLTLDRDFEPEVATAYHVILRGKDGKEWGPVEVDSFPAGRTINLNAADRGTVETAMGLLDDILPGARREIAHVLICREDSRPFDGLVVSCIPDGSDRFTVLAVKDDQRVHLADETEIIPAPYTPPSLYAQVPEAPTIEGLYAVARNGTLHIELEAGWQPAAGALRYVAEISYDDDSSPGQSPTLLVSETASWTPVHDSVGTKFTTVILPQDWTLRVAGIGIRQGEWTYFSGTSPAPLLAPGTVDDTSLTAKLNAWLQQLDVTREAALGPIIAALNDKVDLLGQTTSGLVAILNEYIDTSIVNYIGNANANITEVRTVADGFADMFIQAFAGNDVQAATALFRMTAQILDDDGATGVEISLRARAEVNELFKEAGISIWAFADDFGGTAGVTLDGDKILIKGPDSIERNALLFPTMDVPRDAPITVEGAANVIRANLSSRELRHHTVMDDDAEMRAPIGLASMDYTHDVARQGANHALTFSDQFVAPQPTGVSELDGAINQFQISVKTVNPVRLHARYVGSYSDTPIISVRDTISVFGQVSTSGSDQPPAADLSTLDFVPGSLLLFIGDARQLSNSTFAISESDLSGVWSSIVAPVGPGQNSLRARAIWRVADGSETTVTPWTWGGAGSRWNAYAGRVYAIDFLGGSFGHLSANGQCLRTGNGFTTQTITLSGQPVPILGVSYACHFNTAGSTVTPDQQFSVTPDHNDNASVTLDSNRWFAHRTKIRHYTSSPANITTGASFTANLSSSLISFGLGLS